MALACTPCNEPSLNRIPSNNIEVPTLAEGEILGVQISPSGRTIASCSADKTIRNATAFSPSNNELLLVLKGHKGAVLQSCWAAEGDVDYTAAVWDLMTGTRIKRLTGHEDIVNTCAAARRQHPNLLVTGSDDGCTKLWDLRVNRSAVTFPGRYQVLSVAFDETTCRVFSGSLDNRTRVFDVRHAMTSSVRKEETNPDPSELFVLRGHVNAVTGISLSCNGEYLATNSMDQTVRLWDVRPFFSGDNSLRCICIAKGPTHNFEQILHRVNWSPDDSKVAVGSADRTACIISFQGVESGLNEPKLVYRLPGHNGAVTEACFHPIENFIVTASTDRHTFIRKLG